MPSPRRDLRRLRRTNGATLLAFVALLALVLGLARMALPELVEAYVNRVLDRTEGYRGRVEDVDLALYRGGYRIEGVELWQSEGDVERPLVAISAIDLTLGWGALLAGSLVGDLVLESPRYNVVAAPPADPESLAQTGEQVHWTERLEALLPVRINEFEVRNGTLTYADPHATPRVAIQLENIEARGRNWGNVRGEESRRYASMGVRATAFDSGRLELGVEADPLSRHPDFALDLRVRGIDVRELNDFLRAYGGFDASEGRLDLYSEIDAEGGRFSGYVKPLIRNLDVVDDDDESLLTDAWEGVVGVVAELLENQPEDQQGARIPVEGKFAPSLDVWEGLGSVLSNAFLEALPNGLDGSNDALPGSE